VRLPALLSPLFWDYAPDSIDPELHAFVVLERVLEYGSLVSVRWALATYGSERLQDFLRRRGVRVLSRKTLSFWTLVLGLEGEECFAASSLSHSRPFWDF
jgi:hypothetical protein